MEAIKKFIRKYWVWFSILLCLAVVITWQGGGGLIGGTLTCVVTSALCVWLVKTLIPEHAEEMFCKESWKKGIKFALPYLAIAILLLALSVRRSGMTEQITIDLGAVITFPVLAAAEVFLVCGPVLLIMMNRYGKDDVGVFLSILYTGIAYGLVYFAYSCTYMISIEGASVISVIAQGVYVLASTMFLAAVYLRTENFYLTLVVRIIGLVLERGTEIFCAQPVNLYTLVGFENMDCYIVFGASVVLAVVALNYSTEVPPWIKGDFYKKKKRELLVGRDPRLNEPKLKIKRK